MRPARAAERQFAPFADVRREPIHRTRQEGLRGPDLEMERLPPAWSTLSRAMGAVINLFERRSA